MRTRDCRAPSLDLILMLRRVFQANQMYENERESIEAQYRDAKEQVVQRLLGAMEERRRKLREEKEGGEVISGKSRPCP